MSRMWQNFLPLWQDFFFEAVRQNLSANWDQDCFHVSKIEPKE